MPAPTFTISNINVPGGPAGTVDFKDIAFSPTLGVIVVVGSLGTATATCMRSADGGNTWSFPTMPVATTWLGVVWSPTLGKFFACNPSNVTCAIASSPDGTTWTNEASKAAVPCAAYCIEWSPSLGILVVGSAAAGVSTTRFARSSNGSAWTLSTGTPDRLIDTIKWSPDINLFVAAAGVVAVADWMVTSPDGVTWTARTPPADGVRIAANRERHSLLTWAGGAFQIFVCVRSNGSVIKSADGINWSVMTASTDPDAAVIQGVVWVPELAAIVFIGQGSIGVTKNIHYSLDGLSITTYPDFAISNSIWRLCVWDPGHFTLPTVRRNSYTVLMLVPAAPPPATLTIVSVTPSSGDVAGNTTVDIVGTNFDPDIEVVFDHVFPLSLTWVSSTHLIAVTPPGVLGPVTVTVTNPDNSEFASGVDFYTYIYARDTLNGVPPEISWMGSGCNAGAIVPGHGTMIGGTPVTIYGVGFIQGSSVYFGGLPATAVVINPSGASLTCVTPAHQTGAVDVEIVSPRN
jgi:hypothetical protein